jgi:hypothetical protein
MNEPRSIEDGWQSYAAAMGIRAGGPQWRQMRLVFYAGAAWLFGESGPQMDVSIRLRYARELSEHVKRTQQE